MFFSLANSKLPFQNLLLSAWPEQSPQTQQENYGAEEPGLTCHRGLPFCLATAGCLYRMLLVGF